MAIKKNQNSGSRFGATSWTALPIQPIHCKNGPNGQNWQCFLAGSSKTAPTIVIFWIAMGADYSFALISIVRWVPQFFMHNKWILGGWNTNVAKLRIQNGIGKSTRIFCKIFKNICYCSDFGSTQEETDQRFGMMYLETLKFTLQSLTTLTMGKK